MYSIGLFVLTAFSIGMLAAYIRLMRKNRKLEEDMFFLQGDLDWVSSEASKDNEALKMAKHTITVLDRSNREIRTDLEGAYKNLEMILNWEDANPLHRGVGTEVGRNGVHYKFNFDASDFEEQVRKGVATANQLRDALDKGD
jgi:hypothetical protein